MSLETQENLQQVELKPARMHMDVEIERAAIPQMREQFRNSLEVLVKNSEGPIVLTSHSGPDDDSVCSAVALKRWLEAKYPDKTIMVVISNEAVDAWNNLIKPGEVIWAGSEKVKTQEGKERAKDIVDYLDPEKKPSLVCLDGGTYNRFTKQDKKMGEIRHKINTIILDHHQDAASPSNLSLVDPEATATCALLGTMFDIDNLDAETAKLLQLGILRDTMNFSFDQDYSEVKQVAEKLQARSRMSDQEVLNTVIKSEQQKAYKEIFEKNGGQTTREGLPGVSYSYITAKEQEPTKQTTNKNYDLVTARRDYMFETTQKDPSEIFVSISPINTNKDGIATNYGVMLRRRKGSKRDLNLIAKEFENGAGHEGAASGTYPVNAEELTYILEQKKLNPHFNDTEYILKKVLDKLYTVLGKPQEAKESKPKNITQFPRKRQERKAA